jgi:hypothetical protein
VIKEKTIGLSDRPIEENALNLYEIRNDLFNISTDS